eukprot:scaffold268683_cov33-Tisochrysis_lutea.AAC.4
MELHLGRHLPFRSACFLAHMILASTLCIQQPRPLDSILLGVHVMSRMSCPCSALPTASFHSEGKLTDITMKCRAQIPKDFSTQWRGTPWTMGPLSLLPTCASLLLRGGGNFACCAPAYF